MKNLLKIENLSYSVVEQKSVLQREKRLIILSDISFEVPEGQILGIAGESGSGKTTLAKIITGLLPPDCGEIIFNYKKVKSERFSPIQILFQNTGDILNPLRVVEKVIEEAIKIRKGSQADLKGEMKNLFESLGIKDELRSRRGYELSSGEQQRIALARILAVEPKLLILDEPFSAQDVESQLNLLYLFKKINSGRNLTMICISHNLKILKNFAHEILVMYKGKIIEAGSTGEIFQRPKHPYTKFLLKAEKYDLKYEEFYKLENDDMKKTWIE